MKKILILFVALFTLGMAAHAAVGDTFEVDGLRFIITSEENLEAEVSAYTTDSPEITIPQTVNNGTKAYTVTSIGDDAFLRCGSLISVTIPNSVTSIGSSAFCHCSSLTSVTISNSVTYIGGGAFKNCSSLTSVTIPNSVTSIGDNAFSYCSSLTSVTIPNSVTSIGDTAFCDCNSLTSVTIPNSVTRIGINTFCGCSSLTSVTIPNSVTNIENGTFENCSSLTSVTIPNSVTSIGSSAFYGCNSLTSVTIPNSVTSIRSSAFISCESLQNIIVENGNQHYTSENGVLYNLDKSTLLCCPGAKTEFVIPNSVTEIDQFAFYGCCSLASVTIPNSVTIIRMGAFYNCSSLTSVTIPNSVTNIENSTFCGCSSLTSVTIPNSVTYIGGDAFENCGSLTSVTIPNSVTSIGDGAFYHCSSLTSVTIPNSVTIIGYYAFDGCKSLTSITIPNSVTNIGYDVFSGCTSLKTIYALPTTPPRLDSGAFLGVLSDAVVYIPAGSLNEYSATSESDWGYWFSDFREMGALTLTLNTNELSLEEGKSASLTATVTKDDVVTVESETWTSSNPEIATVDGNGLVTAIAKGSATIICTVVDRYGLAHMEYCEVNVTEPSAVESITIDSDDTPAAFYNLNGMPVDGYNLTPGLYIKRQAGKTIKVIVK